MMHEPIYAAPREISDREAALDARERKLDRLERRLDRLRDEARDILRELDE